MSTITKEQLRERARQKVKSLELAVTQSAFADSRAELEEELELARIALASLEAEAVCVIDQSNLDYLKSGSDADVWPASRAEMGDVLLYLSATPAPVSVPVEVSWEDVPDEITEDDMEVALAWAHGFNQCRAAMLQGAENAESRCTIQTATALDSSPKNAESRCSNSPVIADGWVLVPVEPTAEMISSGIAVHYERSQIQIHDRPAPGPMECAYVAMLAAAPQQEVKS
ncbi:TPA: hypothetical protein ACUNBP_002346 [Enterobacter ludwigii]